MYGDDCGGSAEGRWEPQVGEILGVVCPMTAGARDVSARGAWARAVSNVGDDSVSDVFIYKVMP